MDEKDKRILAELAKNARLPVIQISKVVGVSDVAVKKRLEKLEKEGVIRGYHVVVNPAKIGYKVVALVGVNVEPGKLLEVSRKLIQWDNVVFAALTSGDHDIMIELWVKDSEELGRFIDLLNKMEGVKDVFPAIILDVLKEREALPRAFYRELESK